MRVAALVLAILGVVLSPMLIISASLFYLSCAGFVATIVGFILAVRLRRKAREAEEADRLANAAYFVGIAGLLIYVVLLINVIIFLPMLWVK
jgi:hypothetical protein